MSKLIVPDKRYFDTISTDIKTICEPLKQFGITYFAYAKIFDDNTQAPLITHGDSLYHHWQKGFPFCPPLPIEDQGKKIHCMPFLSKDIPKLAMKLFDDNRELFNVSHPIYFLERHKDYTEYYCYAAEAHNAGIINFYLSNIDVLEKFKFYFKDKAKKLMEFPEKNRLSLHPKMCLQIKETLTMDENKKQKILRELCSKNYTLSLHGKDILLTKRELDVLRCLSQGCTIKETARIIKLAPKTIEHYFDNVKIKMDCKKKSEIIKILSDAKLFF
jgi:DNA-binding CsgD family transcriptional regulator